MIDFEVIQTDWEQDPKFQPARKALEPQFEIANALIGARKRARLTQAEVAKRMNVTQSRVAKIESGINVSFNALRRYADATGSKLRISLDPVS